MKLCIVSLNSELSNLAFKGWLQAVLLPVLLFGVGAVGVVALLGQILIEGLSKVTLEDGRLGVALQLLFKLIFCEHICL